MRELPEELTAELLSLVLGKKVVDFTNIQVISGVFCDCMEIKIATQIDPENILIEDCINIDTLTRLMKEWCLKIYNDSHKGCIMSYVETNHYGISEVQDKIFTGNSEFEAVLKATQWVAKEKGLI